MSAKEKGRKGIEAKKILQKHIGEVISILQANPNKFYLQLVQDSLVTMDAYDPDDNTMSKQRQATKLYTECVRAVEITPSQFPKVMDILSYYPQLEQVVDEMKRKGKNAGLMPGSVVHVLSTSEEDDAEEGSSDHGDDTEAKTVKQETLLTKRTKGSSGKSSKKQRVDPSNGQAQSSSKARSSKDSSKNGAANSESGGAGASSGLDSEPTDDDLEKLVASKVSDSGALGIMLHLEMVQIDMIKDEEKRTVIVNRRILAQWKNEKTRTPITWHTLISALQDMKMNKLAGQLMEKFGK